MAELAETTRIASAPDDVWATLADFGGIGRWAPNVEHSCLTTERSEGIGTTRRVQVGRTALLEQVIEWETGERLAYTIEGLPPVVRSVVNTWRVDGAGSMTTVTLTSAVDTGPRPPQQLIARVVGKGLAKSSRQMLAGLKTHLEEGGA